jgi:hypothetical protein
MRGKNRLILAAVGAIAASLAIQSGAEAALAYALVTNPASAGNSRLYTFDTSLPGSFTLKGPSLAVNANQFPSGLDFDGAGNLYASTNLATGFLTDIDPNTGAFSNARGSGLVTGYTISDLSWDVANNRMLALGTTGVPNSSPHIYSINLATGFATLAGAVTGAALDGVDVSLAVRADGTIFMHGVQTDRWYSVNPTTYAATQLGLEGFDSNLGQGGTFDHSTNTLLHAAFNNATFNGQLWSVNQVSGLGTLIGQMGTNVAASAVQVTDIAIVVPEPASVALLGLGGLLVARRRR